MPRIEVGGPAPYPVTVERGTLERVRVPHAQVALIHDAGVPERWVRQVEQALSPALSVQVPARDDSKTVTVYADVLSQLAQAGLTRSGAVVGLGGGATTDLAGFVAATYLRGVAFYSLPTTLLGMVDAAVGGKTGINLPEGKNLVGAFYPARAVWCDPQVLETLPPAVFREGAAEAYKHGLIADPSLLERVLSPDFRPEHPAFEDTLADAIRVKAEVVTRDLTEQGERAHLNFGHTLAHALEAVTHHGMSHGFAVGYGMHYAALLSRALGGTDLSSHTRRFLAWQQPSPLPELSFDDLSPYMARDKKADDQGVRFVLLHDLARPYLARVPDTTLREVYATWQQDCTAFALSPS
ncbi:3-dehydroquinate synthase [Deinococcus sonorensis]|uniref:3-dehydroquinate synthase n=2 Tax=Deinococcus sonorensis TaxID=309891 RepID=A0AAU7U7G5_9DEIO